MRILRSFLDDSSVVALKGEWEGIRSGGRDIFRDGKMAYRFYPCRETTWTAAALDELEEAGDLKFLDSFFLLYSNGCSTPSHRDWRSGVRINVCLTAPLGGGVLTIGSQGVVLSPGDAVVFHPARELHSVSAVIGERLIWSVGRTRDAAEGLFQ